MAQLTKEDTYAFAELLELISFLDEESKNKIPQKLISIFEANALKTYENHLSPELPLEEQNISEKTISYLGVICLNYWCNSEEEKQDLLNKVRENDIRKEKIAFVLLAVAKYYNNVSDDNNNRLYISTSELFKLSRVSIPCKERANYLHFAYKEGILSEHMFVGTNLKIVKFVSDDEPAMELNEDDYKELAYTYLNYKNGGYKHCKKCGKLFKMHKNEPGRLYCRDCGQSSDKSNFKTMKCVDCGVDFITSVLNTKTYRCEECQKIVDKNNTRVRVQKYRERNSM